MKLKIKIKTHCPECMPELIAGGDWIDLKCGETKIIGEAPKVTQGTTYFTVALVSLGVSIELPKGYEAIIAARSSLFKHKGAMLANNIGIIDNNYCGEDDVWMAPLLPFRPFMIKKGERIVQFRIQLSQKATVWQKFKHLFYNGIELVQVPTLAKQNRGGFGSTSGYNQ